MKRIGQFTIIKKIGSGATSTVFLAEDQQSKKQVAIKLLSESLSENEQARERFYREIEMLEKLNHPGIVPVLGQGEINGRLYIVMPVLKGGSLRTKLNDGPLSLSETITILEQIAPAIDAAHADNILHRDIKPHNIILDEKGQAWLSDFGIARLINQPGQTQTVTLIGTPEFMAPEQVADGRLTPQTDIYQLGVTLFQMLTGQYPYSGNPVHIMSQKINAPLPSVLQLRPNLPAGIEQVMAKAMAKEAAQRYQTAVQLVDALKAAADGVTMTHVIVPPLNLVWPEAVSVPDPQPPIPDPQSPTPNPSTTGIAMFATFIAVCLLAIFLIGGQGLNDAFQTIATNDEAVPTAVVETEPDSTDALATIDAEEGVEQVVADTAVDTQAIEATTTEASVAEAIIDEEVTASEADGAAQIQPIEDTEEEVPQDDNVNDPPPPPPDNDGGNNNGGDGGNGNGGGGNDNGGDGNGGGGNGNGRGRGG